MEIAGVAVKGIDKITLTGEQIEEINECLDYLNGYISALSIIGHSCFDSNIDVDITETGMALMGLSKEAERKWSSLQDIITNEVHEQIGKQKKETIHE